MKEIKIFFFETNINSNLTPKIEYRMLTIIAEPYVHICAKTLDNNAHEFKCFGTASYYATGSDDTSNTSTQDTLYFE